MLGQPAITTDYLPIEEDPQVARAVALMLKVAKAKNSINYNLRQIKVAEDNMGDVQGIVVPARIGKCRAKIAAAEIELQESLSELRSLPSDVQEHAAEIAQQQSEADISVK